MKYRKKPVVIEAVRWTGNPLDLNGFINISAYMVEQNSLLIRTLEGTMRADWGDWIIKGIKGEFYPLQA